MSLASKPPREQLGRLPSAKGMYTDEEEGEGDEELEEEGEYEGEANDGSGDEESSNSEDEDLPLENRPLPQPTMGFQSLIQPVSSLFYGPILEDEGEGEDADGRYESKERAKAKAKAKGKQDQEPGNAVMGQQSSILPVSLKANQNSGKQSVTKGNSLSASSPSGSIPTPKADAMGSSGSNLVQSVKSKIEMKSVASKQGSEQKQGNSVGQQSSAGERVDISKTTEKTGPSNLQSETVVKKKKKKKKDPIGVNLTLCKYDSVRRCIANMGWKEVGDEEDWVIFWTDTSVSVERVMGLKKYQKINHFPGTLEIARKANMARNLRRMYKLFPDEYNIFPKTWILPQEMHEFKKVLKKNRSRTFIMKPNAGSQGRGIYLVKKPEDIIQPDNGPFPAMVVQQYLSKPLLIDGYKFDMRIYALIMGCDPLKIFLYKEGMARFCTETYQPPTDSNIENTYMHLTNYSINKFNDKFTSGANEENFGEGSKRTLSAMKSILTDRGIDWDALWAKIADIIIKTMISVQPLLAHLYHTCVADDVEGSACFEILGFDIIIDHKLRPFLLEVNHSPSLTCDTAMDFYIKDNLLRSVCHLLRIDPDYKKKYRKEERVQAQQRIFGNKKKGEETDLGAPEKKESQDPKEKYYEEQSKWEDENMGNFMRIYPTAESAKYDQYFAAALSGIVGETQASIGKKLSTMKKLEEQEKSNALRPPKASSNRVPERKAGERPVNERAGQERGVGEKGLSERRGSIERKGRSPSFGLDGLSLDLSQPKDGGVDDESDFKKKSLAVDGPRQPGPLSRRSSLSLPIIHDPSYAASHSMGYEKLDVIGLTESQALEFCMPMPDDRYKNPDFQKRLRLIRASGIKEKVAYMVTSIMEAQRVARQQTLAQRQSRKEESLVDGRGLEVQTKSQKTKDEPDIDGQQKYGGQVETMQIPESAYRVSVYVPVHLRKQLTGPPVPVQKVNPASGTIFSQSRQRILEGAKGQLHSLANDTAAKGGGSLNLQQNPTHEMNLQERVYPLGGHGSSHINEFGLVGDGFKGNPISTGE
eukprot:TRINITY_DN1319_c0_g2_i5.p1 TRINITY_DN1319_c0_g2~~TRINITY_DN1319_c0_g2_i5.p1  ORF type:complete len:1041 (+),score=232.86 TRINITY_DN1319_c0_g2_i5:50-3172(+)